MVFPIGPILSIEFEKSINPYLETLPYVGHNPNMPQKEAGSAIEPPVLSPRELCGKEAIFAMPAAPPDEPPQLLSLSMGFFGPLKPMPTLTEKLPNPNSSCEVFPIIMPPSSFTLSMTKASNNGLYPCKIFEPAVVSTS